MGGKYVRELTFKMQLLPSMMEEWMLSLKWMIMEMQSSQVMLKTFASSGQHFRSRPIEGSKGMNQDLRNFQLPPQMVFDRVLEQKESNGEIMESGQRKRKKRNKQCTAHADQRSTGPAADESMGSLC